MYYRVRFSFWNHAALCYASGLNQALQTEDDHASPSDTTLEISSAISVTRGSSYQGGKIRLPISTLAPALPLFCVPIVSSHRGSWTNTDILFSRLLTERRLISLHVSGFTKTTSALISGQKNDWDWAQTTHWDSIGMAMFSCTAPHNLTNFNYQSLCLDKVVRRSRQKNSALYVAKIQKTTSTPVLQCYTRVFF